MCCRDEHVDAGMRFCPGSVQENAKLKTSATLLGFWSVAIFLRHWAVSSKREAKRVRELRWCCAGVALILGAACRYAVQRHDLTWLELLSAKVVGALQAPSFSSSAFCSGSRLQLVARRPLRQSASSSRQITQAAAATPERFRLNNLSPQKGARRQEKRKGRGYGSGQVLCPSRYLYLC